MNNFDELRRGFGQPVTVDELKEALQLFSGIHEGSVKTLEDPSDRGLTLVDEDEGTSTRIRFTDNPLNRFGNIMADRFRGGDTAKFSALMMRIFAFMDIMQLEAVQSQWVKSDEDDANHIGLHPAVIDIAASYPLDGDGRFDPEGFLSAVKARAEEEYPDCE